MRKLNINSLRYYRKKRGYTINEVAMKIGRSPSAIGMYERGLRRPDEFYLLELAEVLGLESSEFFFINTNDLKIESIFQIESEELENLKKDLTNQSNGCCNLCNQRAPFNTQSGMPYLLLFNLDLRNVNEIDNYYVLCPNCFSKMTILNLEGDRNFLLNLRSTHNE